MSFLDNTSITVDAVLTSAGREALAKGQLNITKFALGDDEVDYRLYNFAHPSGSDYYGEAIEHMPVLEALPDGVRMLKSKLVTFPKGTTKLPLLTVGGYPNNQVNLVMGENVTLTPQLFNSSDDSLGYTATLQNTQYFSIEGITQVNSSGKLPEGSSSITGTSTIGSFKQFKLSAIILPQTISSTEGSLTIISNNTGNSVTLKITNTNNAI
jgi:hypothetical protein